MTWNWEKLCGNNEIELKAWIQDDFSHCFELYILIGISHILFAGINLFYIIRKSEKLVRDGWSKWILKIRLLFSILITLTPLIALIVQAISDHMTVYAVEIFTCLIVTLSWVLHTIVIWKLQTSFTKHSRGPLILVLIWVLVFAADIIHFRSAIIQDQTWNYMSKSEAYGTFIVTSMHFIYFLTILFKGSSEKVDTIINAISDQNLLHTENQIHLKQAEDANIFSQLIFWWVQPLMIKGSKQLLTSSDELFPLPNAIITKNVVEKFKQTWIKEETRCNELNEKNQFQDESQYKRIETKSKRIKISFLNCLIKCFGFEYFSLGILKLFGDSLAFVGPILLKLLVEYMESDNIKEEYLGYIYAVGLFLASLFSCLFITQFNYFIYRVGFKIRAAIITTVYQKTLMVSSTALSSFSTGEVVNFMSTDTDRIVNFCPSFHQLWSLPFQISASLYLLYQEVQLAFLAGVTFAILLIPINKWLANKIGILSEQMMEHKDNRVKIMSEILNGIRVIKFYAWEKHFSKNINNFREKELHCLRGRKYLDAMCVYFWATTPTLISILTFATYYVMGKELTASKVFTSVALFNMLITPLNDFPWMLNMLMEAWVSIKRLSNFLQLEEVDTKTYYTHLTDSSPNLAIQINNATFSWKSKKREEKNSLELSTTSSMKQTLTQQLHNINLDIHKGNLIGIIGKVGTGKSSLLNAILAEMYKESGEIKVADLSRGFGLAAQEPWIQCATVRENILFGKRFDSEKYKNILEACCLLEDLKILPAGDQTEIGESGVTLSGGQKARLALARAVYQDKDVYMLDDPLAAVDAHVAQHLFNECIEGILQNKTRILCTHHVRFLQKADLLVVLEEGNIIYSGPPQDYFQTPSSLDYYEKEKDTYKDEEDNSKELSTKDESDKDELLSKNEGLIQDEEKDVGTVKFHVYKSYWLAVGNCLAAWVLISIGLMQISRNVNDWWLSYWVSHTNESNQTDRVNESTSFYLIVYGSLAGTNSFLTLLRAFLFAYGGIIAAQTIHTKLFNSILRAPISFFAVTQVGRIINRFSSDLYSVDDMLSFVMNIFLAQFFSVLGTIAITCYGLPYFAIPLVPLGFFYYYIQVYYRHTSRELKRLSSVTLSPIYNHFSETLAGLTSIRAFREVERFKSENEERLECNQKAQFAGQAATQWLNLRLQMLGVSMITAVAFIAVLEHKFKVANPGLVGLALSYALSITNLLNGVVTYFTQTEKEMVSVERCIQYIDGITSERLYGTFEPSSQWPDYGIVQFEEVEMQYREGLPNALDKVTFATKPGEKIGIVGRTGSGKSSLFLALFRMVEIKQGQIFIDEVDVSYLDLETLRSRLVIIPQDPFLFSGTIRENLDPTESYSDTNLWLILERCYIKKAIVSMGGLYGLVTERGKQFSVGQRQLMCLARALLTNAKIICIDEATASVDQETDQLIQKTIREAFVYNTVITIAHRINTILDCDRVLVMGTGKVQEFDNPQTLLSDKNSQFYSLVAEGT